MLVSHPVSDLATIIRNGYLANRKLVSSPIAKIREDILKILKEEGYILNYSKNPENKKFDIHLKYQSSKAVISEITVISKPGKRVYCNYKEIPMVKNGLGIIILSTSKGVVSDNYARINKVGGEILLKIF